MFRSRDNIHRPVSESALLNRHFLINDTKPSFESQNWILFHHRERTSQLSYAAGPRSEPRGPGRPCPRKPPARESQGASLPGRTRIPRRSRQGARAPGRAPCGALQRPGSPSSALRPGRPAPRSPRNRSPPARPRAPSPALAAGREPRPPVCGRVETGGRRQLQVRRNQLGKRRRPLAHGG